MCLLIATIGLGCTFNTTPVVNQDLSTLPKQAESILRKIQEVEYQNLGLMRQEVKKLRGFSDENVGIYAKFYSLKADFLETFNIKNLRRLDSVYKDLKEKRMYKLMAEIDIWGTYMSYEYLDFKSAAEYVQRSLDYCFNDDMFLERQALIYGISPTALVNTPQEKKEEILNAVQEAPYEWSFYHSRIYNNLARSYFYLGEYESAKEVLLKTVANNKKKRISLGNRR